MKMTIRDSTGIPYGGQYKLNIPAQGLVGVGRTFDELLYAIERYRHANAIPIGLGFRSEVEQAVCAQYPRECLNELPPSVPAPQKLGWKTVLQGTVMMAKHLAAGSPLVDEATANRRAAQCATCLWLTSIQMPCASICSELEAAVKAVIGARTTTSDSAIKNKSCMVCGCYSSASVWVPLDLQQSVLTDEQKKAFVEVNRERGCWKAEGL